MSVVRIRSLVAASMAAFCVCAASVAEELPVGNRFAVAIEKGSVAAVMALVEEGNSPDTPIEYGENVWTPLMKASWDGELEIAQYLIAKGAQVNFANQDGETALHQAIGRGQTELVKLLLDKGARTDQADVRQFMPLHKAAAAGHVEIVRLLVGAKAALQPEMYGLTPLMFAVSGRQQETVKTLLSLGADVNYASKSGNVGQTALYSAIQTADAEMLQLLLELGANPNVKTADGKTPLAAAQDGDQDDLIALLKAAGAKK